MNMLTMHLKRCDCTGHPDRSVGQPIIQYLGSVLLLGCILLVGCDRNDTPEGRIRAFVDEVVETAEARKWRSFDNFIAEDYADDQGLDKKAVAAIAARYLIANQSIHILKRVSDIEIEEPRARATVYAAMAGQPVDGPQDLLRLNADVYRFNIELAPDGDSFLITSAAWEPAYVEDLIPRP